MRNILQQMSNFLNIISNYRGKGQGHISELRSLSTKNNSLISITNLRKRMQKNTFYRDLNTWCFSNGTFKFAHMTGNIYMLQDWTFVDFSYVIY